ncbi:MAG: DUF6491 family protein [Woeseiaceae bacterium]|nr:DUF6491 family protein [Woeseiaceae bacterium]
MNLRLAAIALLLGGCATAMEPSEVRAVRDFVALSDLERVDRIRLYRKPAFTYVNDYFITASVAERHYLVEFNGRCRALRARGLSVSTVDHRLDLSYLKVPDTIRGCPTEKIYRATVEQLVELKELSKSAANGASVP